MTSRGGAKSESVPCSVGDGERFVDRAKDAEGIDLAVTPLEERLYRFRCVETWAMAVPWTGFMISHLIKEVDPKPDAKFIRMVTAHRPEQMPGIRSQQHYPWPYYEALRIDEAMNELALFVTGIYGKPLPKQNGAPFRLITPWKYGLKSIKSIVEIEFTKKRPGAEMRSAQSYDRELLRETIDQRGPLRRSKHRGK